MFSPAAHLHVELLRKSRMVHDGASVTLSSIIIKNSPVL